MPSPYFETPHADRQFIIYLIILIVFGLLSLSSATVAVGYAGEHDRFYYVIRQIALGLIPGIILFILAVRLDYHFFKKVSWLVYGGVVLLLVLVFTPVGLEINKSRSWLGIGGFTFQPAEAAKFAIVVIMAYLLADTKRNWYDWKNQLIPVLAVIGLPVGLVLLQGDLGTAMIMIVIIGILLILGKVPTPYLLIMGLIGITIVSILIFGVKHRQERVLVFWDPEKYAQKDFGVQVQQSKIAVGSGGLWGRGYGKSRQKFSYLPEVNSDSVFPIIGEELGFVGTTFLVGLIILICWRGLKIAAHAPDQFGQFLVVGVVVWFGWQSFLNIGGIIGALPLTGVPLPLVSHGGSAYMMMLAGLGVIVSVSRQSKVGDTRTFLHGKRE